MMNDCVAVRTHWPKIATWVDGVVCADFRERPNVVNVNVAFRVRAIDFSEVEAAGTTAAAMNSDTSSSRFRTPLVRVDGDPLNSALDEGGNVKDFIRQDEFGTWSYPSKAFQRFCNLGKHLPNEAFGCTPTP